MFNISKVRTKNVSHYYYDEPLMILTSIFMMIVFVRKYIIRPRENTQGSCEKTKEL